MREKQDLSPEKPAYLSRILKTFEVIHITVVELAVIFLLIGHAIQLNQEEWQKIFYAPYPAIPMPVR